jgi:hypothetical protein
MPSTVFKSTIPASNGPQTHASDHLATGGLAHGLFSMDMSSLSETEICGSP